MSPLFSGHARVLSGALALAALGFGPASAQTTAGPAAPAPEAPGPVLSLSDAQAEAVRSQRGVRIAELEVERQLNLWKAARAERFPRIEAGAIGSYQAYRDGGLNKRQVTTIPGLGVGPIFENLDERFNAFMGVSVSQPLLGLYTINLKGRLQQAEVETARERLRQTVQETLAAVSRAYFELVATQSAWDANEEAIRYYRETERMVSRQVQEQAALRPALLTVRAQLAAAEQKAVALGNELESGEERLNLLLGRDVRTRFRVATPADVDPPAADLKALQDEALRRRPDLAQASLQVKKAELGRKLAEAQYRPDLNVGATYLHSFSSDFISDNTVSLGFAFRMELWDGGRRRYQVQASERAVDQARTSLEDSRDRVLLDVAAQYRSLMNAQAGMRAAEAARTAASAQVETGLAQYRERAITLSDLLKMQSSLADANAQRQQAFSAYLTSAAELNRAIGGTSNVPSTHRPGSPDRDRKPADGLPKG